MTGTAEREDRHHGRTSTAHGPRQGGGSVSWGRARATYGDSKHEVDEKLSAAARCRAPQSRGAPPRDHCRALPGRVSGDVIFHTRCSASATASCAHTAPRRTRAVRPPHHVNRQAPHERSWRSSRSCARSVRGTATAVQTLPRGTTARAQAGQAVGNRHRVQCSARRSGRGGPRCAEEVEEVAVQAGAHPQRPRCDRCESSTSRPGAANAKGQRQRDPLGGPSWAGSRPSGERRERDRP